MYWHFVRLRLRWYMITSAQLVLKHWQWVLLACVIVPGPPVVSIFSDAALVFGAFVSPGLSAVPRFCLAVIIDLAAILWILPQRHALSGGAFMRYASTLPVPRGVRFAVGATLLVAANSVILITAVIALAGIWVQGRGPFAVCCFVALLGLAAMAQQAILARRMIGLAGVILGDGLLAAGLAAPSSGARWLLLMGAMAGAVPCLLITGRSPGVPAGIGAWRGIRALSRRAPALLIQLKSLAERPVQTIMRLGVAIALALGADRLMLIFHFDGRAFPTAIMAMAAISLLQAGFYRLLGDVRRPVASYLSALPLPQHFWPRCDTAFVLLLNAVPLSILLLPHLARGLWPLLIILSLAMTCQGLLAILRWPVVHGGRRSLMYGVLLTALWSGAAIAAVSR